MSNYQSEVYECARGDAIWKSDDNSEWINKFSEGIKVERGDNIRILGSFIHEGSSGEEIEIDKDQQINIAFSPYIQASTLAIDVNTNIVDLSQFSDVPYSTDAFGIEPPLWFEDKGYAETATNNYNFPTNNEVAYGVPLATAQQPIDFGNKICKWYTLNSKLVNPFTAVNRQDDVAKTWGNNLQLNDYNVDATNSINKGYKNFTQKTIPQELYISQVVKKFILPFYDGTTTTGTINQFAEMVNVAPDWGSNDGAGGYFNGFPQVGMCIATVDIGASNGWYDSTGNGFYERNWRIGVPNLKSGVQSLIGTIIAVRPIWHNILGKTTGTFEILVSNWVNPSTISNKTYSHQFGNSEVVEARSLTNAGTNKNLFKQIHGGNENKEQYSNNPSFNGSNGGYFQYNNPGTTTTLQGGASRDMMSGMPTTTYNKNITLSGQDQVITGSNDNTPNDFQLGYGMPQGTSFLWNGSYNGDLRYSQEVNATDGTMINNDKPRRARCIFHWDRPVDTPAPSPANAGTNGLWCRINHQDVSLPKIDNDFFPSEPVDPSPNIMGGYIICSRTTMEAVVRGEVVSESDPNYYSGEAGKTPRVWIEYSHQASVSHYLSRHYAENSWTNDAATETSELPGSLNNNNLRHGYVFAGMPLAINWRQGTAIPQNYGTGFQIGDNYPGGYSTTAGYESAGVFGTKGDAMARIWASPDGTAPVVVPNASFKGLPTEWCAYNTCINSIHFQQKETGDINLGKNTVILKTKLANLQPANSYIIIVPVLDTINVATGLQEQPNVGDLVKLLHSDVFYNDYYPIDSVSIVGLNYHIDFSILRNQYKLLIDAPADTVVYIYRNGGMSNGVGVNANPWSADCLMIKENLTKCSVPKGFYTEQQLSEYINTQLHYTNREYAVKMGTKNVDNTFNIPTTVGNGESNICSNPTILNGNFVHTYIPDVTYGFSPITQNTSAGTDLLATTKELNDELFTYDVFRGIAGDGTLAKWQFYWSEEIDTIRPYDGNNTRKLSESRLNVIGKHFKLYSIPEIEPTTPNPVNNKNIQLIRLTGGALNVDDYVLPVPASPPDPAVNGYWNNALKRWCGSFEMLRDKNGNTHGPAGSGPINYGATFSYPTRLNRNLLSYGGSSKIFCGANNITFEWDEGRNRFSLNNLYTPIRPHLPQTSGADFGNGDAIPSTILNTMYNGFVRGQLTGIYINNLNAGIFDKANWGDAPCGDKYLYDTLSSDQITELGNNFLNTLGYTTEQLSKFDNSFNIVTDIFVYRNETEFSGAAIRIAPKLSTAINGSNPSASRCLNIAPVVQFFVESETDDFFAINVPSKGNSPYYFIGSSFPTKKFFGNKEGSKLPVIGICSRNFHSFNFAFDLGGSSISYTMEENTTITSIRTKIYNSSLGTPANLSPFSAVIYVITRNNYIKDLSEPQEQEAAQMYLQSKNPLLIPNSFQTQAPANYRTEPPVFIPPNYDVPQGADFQYNFEDSDSD